MGEEISLLLGLLRLQAGGTGSDMVCTYLIILGVILVVLYLGLFIYNKMVVGRRQKQHPCKYCGHMVSAVSQCCGAPVEEKFMGGRCSKCGKETKTVCAICKREHY